MSEASVTITCNQIQGLVAEMKDMTLAAGVQESTYSKITEVPSNLTIEDLEGRLAFLKAVRENEYQGVLVIWRLLKPEVWKRYEDFGETQLREQKLLREARKLLRRVWRKRYGEKANPGEQGIDSSSVAGSLV